MKRGFVRPLFAETTAVPLQEIRGGEADLTQLPEGHMYTGSFHDDAHDDAGPSIGGEVIVVRREVW